VDRNKTVDRDLTGRMDRRRKEDKKLRRIHYITTPKS